jgi:hypothetical protein
MCDKLANIHPQPIPGPQYFDMTYIYIYTNVAAILFDVCNIVGPRKFKPKAIQNRNWQQSHNSGRLSSFCLFEIFPNAGSSRAQRWDTHGCSSG